MCVCVYACVCLSITPHIGMQVDDVLDTHDVHSEDWFDLFSKMPVLSRQSASEYGLSLLHTYTNTHTCMDAYTHAHTYVYAHICIQRIWCVGRLCLCPLSHTMHSYTCTHVRTCAYTHICTDMVEDTHIYKHTRTQCNRFKIGISLCMVTSLTHTLPHVRARSQTYVHTHTRIHAHVHKDMQ